MIVSTSETRCVVCGRYTDPLEPGRDNPKNYHVSCAKKANAVAVLWRGKALQGSDEDLSWVREELGLYLGVAFEDERRIFSATVVVRGVESEGEGANAIEALDSAYIELQQEVLRITAEVWQLGQGT